MKGTIISILVGALVGALLTLGSGMHASRAGAPRHGEPLDAVASPLPADITQATSPPALSDELGSEGERAAAE